ncbi:hypothetical protein B0A48_04394 [Cryoendolithus antarcticus]|uniref:GATA-type domain-containing protein n=1 Tax=Cryoendolithus antarcticus TaxID=1507870 RepID=A0A1V8TFK0_9PEZI|nr:hypothetical protein B0A48_04394 [Cryoendolithus antarcticus]
MDPTSVKPQLPSVGYLDIDKPHRDDDGYQKQYGGPPPSALRSSALPSPTSQYPSGPPPPYSHPAPPQPRRLDGIPTAQPGAPTPPESRRMSDEKEAIKQVVRQSLPSISEALGVDNQSPYHASLLNQHIPTSMHAPAVKPLERSPPSPSRRTYAMEPPQLPPDHHVSAHSHYSQYRQETPVKPTYPPIDTGRSSYGESRPPMPQHQYSAPHSPRLPREPSQYAPPPRSPRIEHHAPHSATMPPPAPATFAYGYTPYPPRYAQPVAAPPPAAPGPIYQPSLSHAAPSTPTASWESKGASRSGAPDERAYGDSVKRHLDMFDIEAALTDVTHTSTSLTDFSRRYGDRLHHAARSEPSLSTLPSIVEVEDMMAKSRLQLDALTKIREVVVTQQIAFDQQAAEQQQHRQKVQYSEPPTSASDMDLDDAKLGFAGAEAKKRRGRAAPPGRCHSCNRAETPEWRRGPDGARTLCNACGLHYAKLTRKQNSAAKSGMSNGASGSNLRPKEMI